MRWLSLIIVWCTSVLFVSAQSKDAERLLINDYTEEANRLIWHINSSIEALADFQDELNVWFQSSDASTYNAPEFEYKSLEDLNLNAMLDSATMAPSNPVFNYQSTFSALKKQVLLFDSFCKQIEQLPRSGSSQDYYERGMKILFQVDNMAPDMVNLCYDFSLSCAVNYGKEKLPVELERLKNLVGQAKNVIMAIRDNDPVQSKTYLNQLNMAIIASMNDERLNDLKRVGKFQVDEESLKEMHQQVLEAADLIAFWAEQYLQSSYADEEVLPILQSAITAFNVFEGKAGCSGAYNDLVSQSKNQYLFYTEEPMFFQLDVRQQEAPQVSTLEIKQDTVIINETENQAIVQVDSVKSPEPVVFDADDISTLDGSLPNNILIMMDVSASMKLTGKLPLLKSSILHLVDIMRPEDRLSLLAYSGEADVLIAQAGIANKEAIRAVLDTLHSSGGTDIQKGMELGFETILSAYMQEGNNRIIIATDGEFGVRKTLIDLVESYGDENIYLSIFQYNEAKDQSTNPSLENLATIGKGNYRIITNNDEALNVLMREVKKAELD